MLICEVYKSRLVKLFSVFVILKEQKNWTPIVNTHCIKIGVQLWSECNYRISENTDISMVCWSSARGIHSKISK